MVYVACMVVVVIVPGPPVAAGQLSFPPTHDILAAVGQVTGVGENYFLSYQVMVDGGFCLGRQHSDGKYNLHDVVFRPMW